MRANWRLHAWFKAEHGISLQGDAAGERLLVHAHKWHYSLSFRVESKSALIFKHQRRVLLHIPSGSSRQPHQLIVPMCYDKAQASTYIAPKCRLFRFYIDRDTSFLAPKEQVKFLARTMRRTKCYNIYLWAPNYECHVNQGRARKKTKLWSNFFNTIDKRKVTSGAQPHTQAHNKPSIDSQGFLNTRLPCWYSNSNSANWSLGTKVVQTIPARHNGHVLRSEEPLIIGSVISVEME